MEENKAFIFSDDMFMLNTRPPKCIYPLFILGVRHGEDFMEYATRNSGYF